MAAAVTGSNQRFPGGTVRSVGERRLIAAIGAIAGRSKLPKGAIGIGDDCAVVPAEAGTEVLLEVDESIEGVHFRLDWMTAADVGHRLATQGLSDIAAMGGMPRGALLALGVPSETDVGVLLEMVEGFAQQTARFGAPLLGGNVSATGGPLHATVTVVGEIEQGKSVLRTGGRAGDGVYITGFPGLARAAWHLLERGLHDRAEVQPALLRYRRPEPRVHEGRFLLRSGVVSAMIDVSDGIAGDLAQLVDASGVSAVVQVEDLPVSPELRAAARVLDSDPLEILLAGGDDFELLLAGPVESVDRIREDFEARFGVRLTRIGWLEEGAGVHLSSRSTGVRRRLEQNSYRHFQ
ncbi:thiamine-phosphate kinase [Planctomycetota bacterium]